MCDQADELCHVRPGGRDDRPPLMFLRPREGTVDTATVQNATRGRAPHARLLAAQLVADE